MSAQQLTRRYTKQLFEAQTALFHATETAYQLEALVQPSQRSSALDALRGALLTLETQTGIKSDSWNFPKWKARKGKRA